METLGATGDMSHAEETLATLTEEFDQLVVALDQLTKEANV